MSAGLTGPRSPADRGGEHSNRRGALRPDRIIVGEVRGAEAFELTRAVNAGCGFGCTIHANSARDPLNALVNAAMMAGENVAEPVKRRVFSSSLDFVVHLDRETTGFRDGAVRRQVVPSINPLVLRPFATLARCGKRSASDEPEQGST